MLLIIEQILNGLQLGIMLFLMSAGLTLVFGIMQVINLAHGSFYMIGAYVGATVRLQDLDTDEECAYILVSPPEADYEQNKISIESPIGKALLGRAEKEEVTVTVPAGTLRYRILKITRG